MTGGGEETEDAHVCPTCALICMLNFYLNTITNFNSMFNDIYKQSSSKSIACTKKLANVLHVQTN